MHVHYGGNVVEADKGGAKFSHSMELKVVTFKTCPMLLELEGRVKDVLGWNAYGMRVQLQGRYDVGHGYSHKVMMQLESQYE